MQNPDPPPPSKPTAFSLSLGSKPKSAPRKPAATPFSNKRSAAHLASDDEASDDDDAHRGKVQLVSGFDSNKGGALDASGEGRKTAAPLVIPAQKNRDWKKEAEMRRGGKKSIWVPPEATQGPVAEEDLVEKDVQEQKFGLQVFEKDKAEGSGSHQVNGEEEKDEEKPEPSRPKTEDELALAALLNGDSAAKSDLVITAADGDKDWTSGRDTEDDAYRKDVSSRPDMATLDDYAAVPVEQFGAALLRGMGWKEGEEIGRRKGQVSKPRVVEKRPAFLGIGAKAKEEIPELGVWGKGDKKRKSTRVDTTYVPVVMVDKKTGKVVDEATLNGNGKPDEPSKESRPSERSLDKRNSDRDRSRERNGHSNGHTRSDRDRYSKRDSSRDRSHRDRDRDRDRYRDKDRERYREKDREWRDDRRDERRRDVRRDEKRDRDYRRRSPDRRHR